MSAGQGWSRRGFGSCSKEAKGSECWYFSRSSRDPSNNSSVYAHERIIEGNISWFFDILLLIDAMMLILQDYTEAFQHLSEARILDLLQRRYAHSLIVSLKLTLQIVMFPFLIVLDLFRIIPIGLGWSWFDGAATIWRKQCHSILCKCHLWISW